MKVIVRYPGYDPALEEDLYIATRRRPDQVGEQIHHPPLSEKRADPKPDDIHFPELRSKHERVLTYEDVTPQIAEQLAEVAGVTSAVVLEIPGQDDSVELVGLKARLLAEEKAKPAVVEEKPAPKPIVLGASQPKA